MSWTGATALMPKKWNWRGERRGQPETIYPKILKKSCGKKMGKNTSSNTLPWRSASASTSSQSISQLTISTTEMEKSSSKRLTSPRQAKSSRKISLGSSSLETQVKKLRLYLWSLWPMKPRTELNFVRQRGSSAAALEDQMFCTVSKKIKIG